MLGRYPVTIGGETRGELQVSKDGAVWLFEAEAEDPGAVSYTHLDVYKRQEFLITQMFFDNSIFYNFLYRIRERGIEVPVSAGIMPVTNRKQIRRITQLSGNYLPEKFKAVVDRFGDDLAAMRQAGVAYATGQIIDLIANGVNHIHVFTMNKPEVAQGIHASLSELLK